MPIQQISVSSKQKLRRTSNQFSFIYLFFEKVAKSRFFRRSSIARTTFCRSPCLQKRKCWRWINCTNIRGRSYWFSYSTYCQGHGGFQNSHCRYQTTHKDMDNVALKSTTSSFLKTYDDFQTLCGNASLIIFFIWGSPCPSYLKNYLCKHPPPRLKKLCI